MLQLSSSQMALFDHIAEKTFREEMIAHARMFSPRLSRTIGDEQLTLAVHDAIDRARAMGLRCRGAIRTCVELTFLCGSGFLDDPQYPLLGQTLMGPGDDMTRARKVYDMIVDYQAQVSGKGASNLHRALKSLLEFTRNPPAFGERTFRSQMLSAHAAIYPEKTRYLGEENLAGLIDRAEAVAGEVGFQSPHSRALIACLMFGFGHRCAQDPLYPWIGRTLTDQRITTSQARAERLERKAIVWLEHVVAGNESATKSGSTV